MNQSSIEIREYRSLEEAQALIPFWDELLSAYPGATTFSTWEWLASWWRNFAKNDQLLVLGFFQGEMLVGLAPLSITPYRTPARLTLKLLRLMGDGSGDSDNLDFPVLPGYEGQFASALVNYLEKQRLWDFCELNTLPPDSPAAGALLTLVKQRGWKAASSTRVASAISLPDTWEAYLQQLPSEDQKNLVRYTKRLEKRYQTRIYRVTDETQLPACLEAMFRLHQARWQADGQPGSFGSAERRAFYYDLSRALLKRGWLEFWVMELNGAIASAQYAFRYRDKVFQLQEGNDPANSSDRVGFLLRGHVMKQLIAEGVRLYDFLGGEPGYKARWGAQVGQYLDIHFARPFSLGAAYLWTLQNAAVSKEWLRRKLPKSTWQKLHKINVGIRGSRNVRTGSDSSVSPAVDGQKPTAAEPVISVESKRE